MKKVLLTAMAILTVASASAFGMYGANSDWIDFLTDGNMLKARMDTLGFTLGNGTIKGTFGFKNAGGSILSTSSVTPTDGDYTAQESKRFYNFQPTLSLGIGYTTEAFGIGVGYNYQYLHNSLRGMTKNGVGLSVHTPVIAFNALNNRLKIVVPIQVAVKNNNHDKREGSDYDPKNNKYLGLSLDPQIRFYPGLDFLTEFRLTVKYGMNQYSQDEYNVTSGKVETLKDTVSSFGFDFRTYFAAQVGDIALSPFIKVTYDTALNAERKNLAPISVLAGDANIANKLDANADLVNAYNYYDSNPWKLVVLPTLGLSANSDVVSVYGEVGLGYKAVSTGFKYNKDARNSVNNNGTPDDPTDDITYNNPRNDITKSGVLHSLAWKAYGEVKVTPIKDLEWYLEMEIGNDTAGAGANPNTGAFNFATGTGLTWYLPSLNGAE